MVFGQQEGSRSRLVWALGVGAALALVAYWAFMPVDVSQQLEPRRSDAWVSTSSMGLPMDHVQPTAAMTQWLLHGDTHEPLDDALVQCFRDPRYWHLPKTDWFVSVPLPVMADYPLRQLHFVRPAQEPFCMYFHGANTFTYWIVQEEPSANGPVFTLLDMDAANFLAVLRSHHEGVYDVERGLCTATECTYKTLQRSGAGYKFKQCRREHSAEDGQVIRTEALNCDD